MSIELTPELRTLCRNTIRFLSADGVEKANSGHPGTPMGAADIAFAMWTEFMDHDPSATDWINRDRFVLSGGHASMLLYSLLHLSGYKVSLDDLKSFRQWDSNTPGHPEVGYTDGVELTTGPLGAGFATAVGMALAAKMHAARFNTAKHAVIDAHIVGICGDGDVQEGVVAEAASLAGHLGLGNLIFVYDNNDITIEGALDKSMGENVGLKFEAMGWFVQHCDGHNQIEVLECLNRAKEETVRPSLIVAKTVIGAGAPTKKGTYGVHGAPLGTTEMKAAKDLANWPHEPFHVPNEVRAVFAQVAERSKARRVAWEAMFAEWRTENPDKAALYDRHMGLETPSDFTDQLLASVEGQVNATRNLSGAIIQKAVSLMPSLIGGAANLEPSTKTGVKGAASIIKASVESDSLPDSSFAGQNLHFGIREHAMGSMANGMVLFGGWLTYNATFLVFSDYMRAPIRLAAISHIPTIFIFTHDSFWVGEDGPTHQPIEHVWSLRLIPNVRLWRPADAVETAMAWSAAALSRKNPSILILTRQSLPALERTESFTNDDILKGGYILAEASSGTPEVTIISTGSEVGACVQARASLEADGVPTRLVSMPCVELFCAQDEAYQNSIIPKSSKRVAVEAGRPEPWHQFVGDGLVIGKKTFGASAPGPLLADKFGFTGEKVYAQIKTWLG